MTRKTTFLKTFRYLLTKEAKRYGLFHTLRSISREKYAERISASILYGLLSSIAIIDIGWQKMEYLSHFTTFLRATTHYSKIGT